MIAILGGTFDPIHNGHLYIAAEVAKRIPLKKILFIPCRQSPHRPPPIASAEDRSMMVKIAASTHPLFELSDIELHRPAPSYMIDTLKLLRKKYVDETFGLIIGSDAYAHFEQWRDWQQILEHAQLLVVNRHEEKKFLDIPPCDISATDIRARIARGDSIAGLVPKAVEEYIVEKKLYGNNSKCPP